MRLSSPLSFAVALGALMLSTAAFADSPTPNLKSNVQKKLDDTIAGQQQKMGLKSSQGGASGSKGTVRPTGGVSGINGTVQRGSCEEWACGASNGTKLTGIVQGKAEAMEPVVSTVTLPSGETVTLR